MKQRLRPYPYLTLSINKMAKYDDQSLKTTTRLDPDSQLPRGILRIQSIVYLFGLELCNNTFSVQIYVVSSQAFLFFYFFFPPRNFHFLRHLSRSFNVTNPCTGQQKSRKCRGKQVDTLHRDRLCPTANYPWLREQSHSVGSETG